MTEGPPATTPNGGPDEAAPDSRADAELLGRTVAGKYKIEKFLGGGAMGAVYKARFAALEKNVAVKVMHRAVASDPNFVGRFHREAKAASRLDHPNSMRVIDFGEEPDGLLYIAMEYVEGRDLYRVIHEDWPISTADVGELVMQALAAIAVAHEMGVIHRDLKPENLMILRAKNDDEKDAYLVKVCDFGIAKITEKDDESSAGKAAGKLTTQGLVVGTPEYMSPEQAKGEKLDPRSDIYSMGVILYQLLTGRTPFTADTPLAVVLKHITEIPQPPSVHYAGVHKGLEAITLKAMAKDKNDRFQTARAMRNAIREAIDGRPMPASRAFGEAATALDVAAPSASDLAAAGTNSALSQAGSGQMMIAAGVTGASPAVGGAPPIGGASASTLTPLGSATGSMEPKKSRTGLFVGALGVAVLVAGGIAGGLFLGRTNSAASTRESQPPVTPPSGVVTSATNGPSPLATATGAITAEPTGTTVTPPVADPKNGKHTTTTTTAHGPATAKSPEHATVAAAATTTPVAAPPPEPPPPVAPTPPAPAPVAPTPPPAPAFNPQTCRAALGAPRSNGATSSKDLTLNGTAGAWTACAQRSFRERPSGPISAAVHLMFTDNKAFRGASCAGCPAPLAQCIASSTQRTVSVNFKGDITGEPAFDVPVTFTCD